MQCLTQADLIATAEHDRRDRAAFWRNPRYDGLECLSATFFTHRFPQHTHDTYVIGAVLAGCNAYSQRGVKIYAGAGDICVINPGVVHDGGAFDRGFSYRMTYPSVALMKELVEDVTGRPAHAAPSFKAPIMRDAEVLALFRSAHERMEAGEESVGADEDLVAAYGLMLLRYADLDGPGFDGGEPRRIERVRAFLEERFCEPVDLKRLAEIAGLSRFQLLRAFRRETGMTPHTYLTDCRVRAARRLLARGESVAHAAFACGFSDQSHLTRLFKAHAGLTPGRFRAARNFIQDGAPSTL
ncbi:MAG TPA: AraC family transcriptional regulator [Roseiarcus sp.]|jgi:AraC-like DNA-binding protein|nr:AraC family transcriptional regulator [Roseiarcus sp.]